MSKQTAKPLTDRAKVVSALVAIGGGIGSANAIELGDIQVQSSLGQPLRASIAYALAPNEELSDYCVSVSAASSGLPTIANTRVSVSNGVITLRGTQAIREPMITARVAIDCPYTPNLVREYLMFIDPVELQQAQSNTRVTPVAAADPIAATPVRAKQTRQPARSPAPADIQQGERYQVRAGESLSEIVQRVEGRKLGLWPSVDAVFRANPSAFLNDDPNRIKAGSWIVIPDSIGSVVAPPANVENAVITTPVRTATVEDSSTASELPTPDSGLDAVAPTNLDDLEASQAPSVDATDAEATTVAESPYVAAGQELIVNDINIDSPEQTPTFGAAESPNAGSARIVEPASTRSALPPALLWSIGGLGLIAALLLFRRRFRDDEYDDAPAVSQDTAMDRTLTETVEVQAEDFGLNDDSPTDRNLALDAAIVVDHDLSHGIDVDFTEAFDGKAELDLNLDGADAAAEIDGTDIIPPPQVEGSSILDEEVMPDDDEYDMSMIVDITKVPDPHDVTARDLHAVEVGAAEDDDYTLNTQADLEILEQDYQDELSATQALNIEIERAAQQLADQLADSHDTLDATGNVHVGDISEMAVSASDDALNETSVLASLHDDDHTETNEELTVNTNNDETAVLPREEDTARLDNGDITAKLKAGEVDDATIEVMTSDGDHTVEIITRDDDDATVEMEIEGGRVNTRNG